MILVILDISIIPSFLIALFFIYFSLFFYEKRRSTFLGDVNKGNRKKRSFPNDKAIKASHPPPLSLMAVGFFLVIK